MSLMKKIAYNTFMQFLSKLGTVIFGTLTIALMARYLGQEGFGEYSTIIAYLAFFGILVDFGLQITMVNLMSKNEKESQLIFNNTFTLRTISAVILFILAPLILLLFPYNEVIKYGAFILTINYALLALHQLLIGYFQKHLKMEKIALAEITGKVLLFLGVWYVTVMNMGLFSILWVIVISTAIQVLIGFIFARKLGKFTFSFDFTVWRRIIHDSWPIAISIAFNLVYFKADTLVLSLSRSQSEVGIYSAPYRILEILTAYPYLFIGLLFPIISSAWNSGDMDKFKHYFQKAFDFLVIAAIPMIIGTLPLADKIMVLIAGKDFEISGVILQLLIFATAIIFVNVIFSYSIVIFNKQRKTIFAYIITAIFALTAYIIFIPIYSYYAAAIITILAELMIFIFNFVISTRTSGFIPKLNILYKSFFASLVMLGAIYLTMSWNVLLTLGFSMIIYFIALYLFKGIKKETVIEILRIKS